MLPGEVRGSEHGDFQALLAGTIFRGGQSPTVEKMDLVDVGKTDHRKRRVDQHVGSGLFKGFAAGGVRCCLTVLHEAGRQRPEAESGFYRPAAEQDGAVMLGNAADDQTGVFVMDVAAVRAYMPGQIVAGGHGERNDRAAELTVTDHVDLGWKFRRRV